MYVRACACYRIFRNPPGIRRSDCNNVLCTHGLFLKSKNVHTQIHACTDTCTHTQHGTETEIETETETGTGTETETEERQRQRQR